MSCLRHELECASDQPRAAAGGAARWLSGRRGLRAGWRDRLHPVSGQRCALRAARWPSGRQARPLPLLPWPACTARAPGPGLPGARRGTVLPVPTRGHAAPPPRERAGPVRHTAIQCGGCARPGQSAGRDPRPPMQTVDERCDGSCRARAKGQRLVWHSRAWPYSPTSRSTWPSGRRSCCGPKPSPVSVQRTNGVGASIEVVSTVAELPPDSTMSALLGSVTSNSGCASGPSASITSTTGNSRRSARYRATVRAGRAPSCLKFDRFEWFGDEVGASAGGV